MAYKNISPEILSETGKASYFNLQRLLTQNNMLFSHQNFHFNTDLRLALQGQYTHNTDKTPAVDKFLRYNKTPDFLNLPIEVLFSPYFYAYADMTLAKNFSGFLLSHPYTNMPLKQNALDYHFPKRAGAAIGNSFFNINVGRGRLNIGKTLNGSMLTADTADRLDYINASVFAKYAKMDMTISELSPKRFYISHSISVRPVKYFSITLHEGIMLYSVFDPKFLNPLMIFHNYAAWKEPYVNASDHPNENSIGCQLAADVNIVPIKGLRLYGQFAMNSFQTPSELASGFSYIPNSMGGLAGAEWAKAFSAGFLVFSGEFMYANPWLYIGAAKPISFYTFRKETSYATASYEKSLIEYWLANPYGPDSITAFFKTAFILPHRYRAEFSYRFVAKGENEEKFFKAKYKHYPSKENPAPARYKTPSGVPSYFHTLQLNGEYTIFKNLQVLGGVSYSYAHGKRTGHSVDISLAAIYSLRGE